MNSSVMQGPADAGVAFEDRLLRAVDVQNQLGLSRAKVYRLMHLNIQPVVRIGGVMSHDLPRLHCHDVLRLVSHIPLMA